MLLNLVRILCWVQTEFNTPFPAPAGRKLAAHHDTLLALNAFSLGILSSQEWLVLAHTLKERKVGLSFHYAAKQNHLLVAFLLEQGPGESVHQ